MLQNPIACYSRQPVGANHSYEYFVKIFEWTSKMNDSQDESARAQTQPKPSTPEASHIDRVSVKPLLFWK